MIRRIVLGIVFLSLASAVLADNVRGKVCHNDGVTAYPGAVVTLVSVAGESAPVYTGADGMYYLRNVPAGAYMMHVKTTGGTSTFRITVLRKDYTDIAPVRVR
jgi:hypothetical protein